MHLSLICAPQLGLSLTKGRFVLHNGLGCGLTLSHFLVERVEVRAIPVNPAGGG